MNETIGICIPTYKRSKQLKKLLKSLHNQIYNQPYINVKLIVVDNDLKESAKSVVDEFNKDIYYYVEPKKGVANVRNKCLDVVKNLKCDYIAFIDDDEIASDEWINSIYNTLKKFNADVAFGPVIETYNEDIPKWIIDGKFFKRPRYKTGKKMEYGATNNALIKISVLNSLNVNFDTSFDKSGGEDTDFFMTLNKHRVNMIWCDEAVVYEEVAIKRAGEEWLTHRAYCGGSNFALCEKKHYKSKIKRIVRILKGLTHCVIGLTKIALSFTSKNKRVKAKMKINLGIGQVIGALGINIGNQY